MSYPIIGSKYNGEQLDRPCLRRLPPGWTIEESRANYRPPWYRRVETWVFIIVALWLLLGAAQTKGIFQ